MGNFIFRWFNRRNIPKKRFFEWHENFWFYKNIGAGFTGSYVSLITQIGLWGAIIKIIWNIDLSLLSKIGIGLGVISIILMQL